MPAQRVSTFNGVVLLSENAHGNYRECQHTDTFVEFGFAGDGVELMAGLQDVAGAKVQVVVEMGAP